MNEKRRSERINYLGTAWLQHQVTRYYCRLENISLHGAMVVFKGISTAPNQHGVKGCLRIYQDGEGPPYIDYIIRVVRFESNVAGLEFLELDVDSKDLLEAIIRKEQYLYHGANKIINMALEVARLRGIELTDIHFDKGELIPERDIHTLRFFAGTDRANVHLHREEIEEFFINNGTASASLEINKAIARLRTGQEALRAANSDRATEYPGYQKSAADGENIAKYAAQTNSLAGESIKGWN